MKAGFAEREYTPAEGPIPGQIKGHYGKGKLTPLMAHAAVIESKGIKANSPYPKTLVVELESGANGYISPDVIQDCGAYEGIYSTIAFTGHGTVDVLVNGATKMLNAMHKEYLDKAIGGVTYRPVYISRKN